MTELQKIKLSAQVQNLRDQAAAAKDALECLEQAKSKGHKTASFAVEAEEFDREFGQTFTAPIQFIIASLEAWQEQVRMALLNIEKEAK